MLTQKKTLTFNKENHKWNLECKAWEDEMTRLFRKNHTYRDDEGNEKKYKDDQDFSDPMDDHTKHPLWRDPKNDLIMKDSFSELLEIKAKGKDSVALEMISYGWVSNTFTHYVCRNIDDDKAEYAVRFSSPYPSVIHLVPVFQFVFERYPKYLHLR